MSNASRIKQLEERIAKLEGKASYDSEYDRPTHVAVIDLHGNVSLKRPVNKDGEAVFFGPGIWVGCLVFNKHGQVILVQQQEIQAVLGENDTLKIKTSYEA